MRLPAGRAGRTWTHPLPHRRIPSLFNEPGHHATDVILPAEEHRQHPDRLARLVDVEPVDRLSDGEMPQTGQDVVMAFAAMGRDRDALGGCTDLGNPQLGTIERALRALAEVEVASQKAVEDQPEFAFGPAANSRRRAVRAALVGKRPGQSRVHLLRVDKGAGAAAGQELAKRGGLQLLGVHALTQQVDPLLQHRAQARVAPGFDQRPGEGVLFVGERDRGLDRHGSLPAALVILSGTGVNAGPPAPRGTPLTRARR